MGCFHAERDAQMLPYYEMTLALTTMRDLAPGDSAVLKAVLSNPALARSSRHACRTWCRTCSTRTPGGGSEASGI